MLRARLAPVQHHALISRIVADEDLRREFGALAAVRGASTAWLPEAAFVRCGRACQSVVHALLRNTAHSNVAHLFDEADRRLPDEDTVTLVTGFIGAYPNAIYWVRPADLPVFVERYGLASEDDYSALLAAVRYSSHRHTFLVLQ